MLSHSSTHGTLNNSGNPEQANQHDSPASAITQSYHNNTPGTLNKSKDPQQAVTPDPQTSTRPLYWRELLPVLFFCGLLGQIPQHLTRYTSFTTVTNLYIYTIIWLATCLISLRLLVATGPLAIASHGWFRNFFMLRELYGCLGDGGCCEKVEVGDLVGAGAFTIVAAVVSYYCSTRLCRWPMEENKSCDQLNELEKA